MKALKIAWSVIWNLVIVFVAAGVLSSFEYSGESPAPAALGFIILGAVNMGFIQLARTNMTLAIASQKQNAKILQSVGNHDEAKYLEDDSNTVLLKLKETEYKFIINAIGTGLVWLLSAFALLGG